MGKDLLELREMAKNFIDERDWRQFQTAKELAINVSVEANELLELFQWNDGKDLDKKLMNEGDKELFKKIKNETADVLFACLAMADHLNFDLEQAFDDKLKALGERYKKDEVKGKVVKIPEYTN